jgi:hypothetical protein
MWRRSRLHRWPCFGRTRNGRLAWRRCDGRWRPPNAQVRGTHQTGRALTLRAAAGALRTGARARKRHPRRSIDLDELTTRPAARGGTSEPDVRRAPEERSHCSTQRNIFRDSCFVVLWSVHGPLDGHSDWSREIQACEHRIESGEHSALGAARVHVARPARGGGIDEHQRTAAGHKHAHRGNERDRLWRALSSQHRHAHHGRRLHRVFQAPCKPNANGLRAPAGARDDVSVETQQDRLIR